MAYSLCVKHHIAAEDVDLQDTGSLHAYSLHLIEKVRRKGAGAVIATRSTKWKERMEDIRRRDAVAAYLLPVYGTADHSLRDMTEEKFMKYLLSLFRMAAAGYVFKMMERRLPFLDPAGSESGLAELLSDIYVGIDHETGGNRNPSPLQQAHHDHSDAVFYAVAGIHHYEAGILQPLQLGDGAFPATHCENHVFMDLRVGELLFGIYIHLTPSFAQLSHDGMKYRRIVGDVVWGEYSCSKYCRYGHFLES